MTMTLDVNGVVDTLSSRMKDFNLLHVLGYLVILYYWRVEGFSSPRQLFQSYSSNKIDRLQSSSTVNEASPEADSNNGQAAVPFDCSFSYQKEEQILQDRFPLSTEAERRRFLIAKSGNLALALESLESYLEWALTHREIEQQIQLHESNEEDDWNDWDLACAAALVLRKEYSPTPLPRVARTFNDRGREACCRRGFRVFYITPGKMDDKMVSLETYALAIALYLDRKLQRESSERVTVVIDARGGEGWRNLHAAQLIPFIQHTSKLLLTMFPERLGRSIVYPVPFAFTWIWSVVRRCLDPVTADKICLLTGPARIRSPPPCDQLVSYFEEDLVTLMEKERVDSFVSTSS